MRILHTADWHLGDRLGRIDRTADLRAAVERVAGLCESERADVLLVAGDLFSELARPDTLRETIGHWQTVFGPFLGRGGTTLAITGTAFPQLSGTALGFVITCGWAGLAVSSPIIGAIAGGDPRRLKKALLLIPGSAVLMVVLILAITANMR